MLIIMDNKINNNKIKELYAIKRSEEVTGLPPANDM